MRIHYLQIDNVNLKMKKAILFLVSSELPVFIPMITLKQEKNSH